jgi:uncharacterized repeat protein (TIGR01451 family)
MLTVNIKNRALALIVLCLATATAGIAQAPIAKPSIKMHLSAAVVRPGGNVAVEQAGTVAPGEVLLYTITSHNEGMKPALGYKATGPIPANTVYVKGSAKADGATELYSIDGGKSFSSKPMIEERQADGAVTKIPAPVSMYTQVRFEWNDPVLVDGRSSASYQVRVK